MAPLGLGRGVTGPTWANRLRSRSEGGGQKGQSNDTGTTRPPPSALFDRIMADSFQFMAFNMVEIAFDSIFGWIFNEGPDRGGTWGGPGSLSALLGLVKLRRRLPRRLSIQQKGGVTFIVASISVSFSRFGCVWIDDMGERRPQKRAKAGRAPPDFATLRRRSANGARAGRWTRW